MSKVKIIFARCLKFNNLRFNDVIYDVTIPNQYKLHQEQLNVYQCWPTHWHYPVNHFKKSLKIPSLDVAKCKFYAPLYKNAQGLASDTQRIRNQHPRIDPKPSKSIVLSDNTVQCFVA